jgi:hypothetical protein
MNVEVFFFLEPPCRFFFQKKKKTTQVIDTNIFWTNNSCQLCIRVDYTITNQQPFVTMSIISWLQGFKKIKSISIIIYVCLFILYTCLKIDNQFDN